ncbi:winged helix-turn-helix domain-containing protein [Caballeronia sp. BR00000012568055]|uniref:ATP-binding protein n=1 Tax=Caballeronia sp. BR00000012568055 TaxID=2918761 RepID=UPI0027D2944B|nr:winged helix-turn-helix domain-containing protein [Caballeronia sp. BR00000012568055]
MIRIGPLQVDLACRAVWLDGETVRLGSRAFDILAVLAAADGALVSKNELMRLVWPDVIVEENNLQVHMSALRKALGENRGLVQTVSGRGYRLARAQTFTHDALKPALASQASSDIVHNLPCNGSTLIGRESAIGDIAQALELSRHVTLVGAGGIGKTRLAVEAARAMLPDFPDGVYLVPLASAADASSVLAALTSVLGVRPSTGTLTAARIARELGERRMLVVLDNCEHVIGPAAELAEALASASGNMRVLATSREPLRVMNERVYWVASLDVPEESVAHEAVLLSSAVQLFLTRARSFDARFSSEDRSLHLTGTVCRRLDGIPLAIELAAARAAVLGIETLAAHLDDRFALLTGGNRTALPRHQTLKATLDWSHALLDDAERTTLRRLGVFANGFTMEAAIAIVQDNSLREFDVIAALSGLVEKSLVVTQVTSGAASYRLLETTRAYALQKLDDNGERRTITLAHARYFASLLDFVDDDARPSEASWQRDRRDVLDDVRAAFVWTLSSNGDVRIGEMLAVKFLTLLFELSLVDECCMCARRWLARSDGRNEQVRMRVQAALAASLVYVHGPDKETRALWSAVLASAIAIGDRSFEARALWGMWNACQSAGEVKSALSFARRFAALAPENSDEDATDVLLGHRITGIAWTYAGEQDKARGSLERFMPHARGMRQRLPLGRSIDQRVVGGATLARVLWLQGERERGLALAEACAAEAIERQQAIVTCMC